MRGFIGWAAPTPAWAVSPNLVALCPTPCAPFFLALCHQLAMWQSRICALGNGIGMDENNSGDNGRGFAWFALPPLRCFIISLPALITRASSPAGSQNYLGIAFRAASRLFALAAMTAPLPLRCVVPLHLSTQSSCTSTSCLAFLCCWTRLA